MKTKKILFILMVTMLVLTGCADKGSPPTGGDGSIIIDDNQTGGHTISKEDGFETQSTIVSLPIEDSSYFEQLPHSLMRGVETLKEGIATLKPTVTLEKAISVDNAKKVMNILWLDEPNLFYLNKEVGFDLDDEGNVKVFTFKYAISDIDEIANTKTAVNRRYSNSETNREVKNYDMFKEVNDALSSLPLNLCTTGDSEVFNGNSFDNIYGARASTPCLNAEGYAKVAAYALRNVGIESVIAYGENVSTLFAEQNVLLPKFKNVEAQYSSNENKAVYKIDTSGMYAWVIVKMNNSYYHYDVLHNIVVNDGPTKNLGGNYNGATLVSDVVSSRYLLSYYSDMFLGQIPSANNDNFTYSFRNKNYFSEVANDSMNRRIKTIIEENMSSSTSWRAQFASVDNFNFFSENIDKQIELYNENALPRISSYDILIVPDTLTIYVYNIKH